MRAHDATPEEMRGGDLPAGGEVSNGQAQSISRASGPRHVGEILDEFIWKLAIAREADRAEAQP